MSMPISNLSWRRHSNLSHWIAAGPKNPILDQKRSFPCKKLQTTWMGIDKICAKYIRIFYLCCPSLPLLVATSFTLKCRVNGWPWRSWNNTLIGITTRTGARPNVWRDESNELWLSWGNQSRSDRSHKKMFIRPEREDIVNSEEFLRTHTVIAFVFDRSKRINKHQHYI